MTTTTSIDQRPGATIDELRAALETIDGGIVELMARRYALTQRIGGTKRAAGLPVVDLAQEAAVIRRAAVLARAAGLPAEPMRALFWHVVGLCRRGQLEES